MQLITLFLETMVILRRNQRRKNHPQASWTSHSIIYFSHFFFSALSQACFHGGQKPASFYFTSLLLIFRKYIMGEFLKQLFNHYSSFIYGVWMLLSIIWCLDLTVNCFFFILLSGVELFLISETEILRKSLELKVRYSRITLPSVHLCFLKLRLPCFNQGGKVTCDKLFAKNFHSMVWALSNRRSAFFS